MAEEGEYLALGFAISRICDVFYVSVLIRGMGLASES